MKKAIIAIAMVLAAGMAFTSTNALAWGYGHGPGHGMRGGQMMRGNYQQGYNAAVYDSAEYQQFLEETRDLRASLRADHAEFQALMAGTNPDPEKVRSLTESISKKEIELSEKAKNNNVPFGRMGRRGGGGYNCPVGYGHRW